MMQQYRYYLYFPFFLLLLIGCVEPYELPVSEGDVKILVVDGFLDADKNVCSIRLSYTQNLADLSAPVPAINAIVILESDQNEQYMLHSSGNGYYEAGNLVVDPLKRYRISVKTMEGNQYLSEYAVYRPTPPIEEVTWRVQDDMVVVEVSTQDPSNNTRYYQWEVEETWQYRSGMYSAYDFDDEGLVRVRREQNYTCWKTDKPNSIFIGSSERLGQDVISKHALLMRPGKSQYFGQKYSVLVKQYAISREEYQYWQLIKKNTENVGSLFDPQPSQVTGNFQCLNNPGLPVLGFFSVRSQQEKRGFITTEDLRPWSFYWQPSMCALDSIDSIRIGELYQSGYDVAAYVEEVKKYTFTSTACADCRSQGGINIQPDFWK